MNTCSSILATSSILDEYLTNFGHIADSAYWLYLAGEFATLRADGLERISESNVELLCRSLSLQISCLSAIAFQLATSRVRNGLCK